MTDKPKNDDKTPVEPIEYVETQDTDVESLSGNNVPTPPKKSG